MKNKKIFIHINSSKVYVYTLNDDKLKSIFSKKIDFENGFDKENGLSESKLEELDDFLGTLTKYTNTIDSESVKLYVTGIFQNLKPLAKERLINYIYINHALYFNIVLEDLESFFIKRGSLYSNTKNIMNGIVIQEFRTIVICGSFRRHIDDIGCLIEKFKNKQIKILSPFSIDITMKSKNAEFVLFDGEEVKNERDTWRLKYEHMQKFKQADAIIVCNPKGYLGEGTLFEIGNISALGKRIIFMENPANFTIHFPYEVGLNF